MRAGGSFVEFGDRLGNMANKKPHDRVQALGLETITAAASRLQIARNTVLYAINTGRLPVYGASSGKANDYVYLIRPEDADQLWGDRTHPLQHDRELIPA